MAKTDLIEPNVLVADIIYKNWELRSPLSVKKIDFKTDMAMVTKPMSVVFEPAGESNRPISGSAITIGYDRRYNIDVVVKVIAELTSKNPIMKAKDRRWSIMQEIERIIKEYGNSITKHNKDWTARIQLGFESFPDANNVREGVYAKTRRIECVLGR